VGNDNWDRINPRHPAYDHKIKEMADEIELLRTTNEELRTKLQGLQERQAAWGESVTAIQKEVADVTANSIKGRIEAWDLIDKMIPYLKYCSLPPDENEPLVFPASTKELLVEIEEKRKGHG